MPVHGTRKPVPFAPQTERAIVKQAPFGSEKLRPTTGVNILPRDAAHAMCDYIMGQRDTLCAGPNIPGSLVERIREYQRQRAKLLAELVVLQSNCDAIAHIPGMTPETMLQAVDVADAIAFRVPLQHDDGTQWTLENVFTRVGFSVRKDATAADTTGKFPNSTSEAAAAWSAPRTGFVYYHW